VQEFGIETPDDLLKLLQEVNQKQKKLPLQVVSRK